MKHTNRFVALFALLALMLSLVGFNPAYAATLVVTKTADTNDGTCDTDCSLREAIAAAAATGDTITFNGALSGGTITLASVLNLTKNVTIDGSALASQIAISGDKNNSGAANAGDVPVFSVHSFVTATLNALRITNGYAGDGGGIANVGTLTVTNSSFSGNIAYIGGGGAIYNAGQLTVTNSTFSGNTAGVGGGAIYNTGQLTVTNSTLSGNTAGAGGNGGGIYNSGGTSTLAVTNSTFSGNIAMNTGGGIYNSLSATLTVRNSTFSGNSASGGGGAGGGIRNNGTLHYSNTIIANSLSGADCRGAGVISTNINNLVEDGNCGVGGVNFLSGDPKLGALANNGGPTQTFALLSGSPAIDAGSDATCAAAPVNNLDQRGFSRTLGMHCDIGAVEGPVHTLTYQGNGNDGGSAPVDGSSPYYEGSSVTVLGNTGALTRTGYTLPYSIQIEILNGTTPPYTHENLKRS